MGRVLTANDSLSQAQALARSSTAGDKPRRRSCRKAAITRECEGIRKPCSTAVARPRSRQRWRAPGIACSPKSKQHYKDTTALHRAKARHVRGNSGWAATQPAALGTTILAGGLTKIAAHSAALGALKPAFRAAIRRCMARGGGQTPRQSCRARAAHWNEPDSQQVSLRTAARPKRGTRCSDSKLSTA